MDSCRLERFRAAKKVSTLVSLCPKDINFILQGLNFDCDGSVCFFSTDGFRSDAQDQRISRSQILGQSQRADAAAQGSDTRTSHEPKTCDEARLVSATMWRGGEESSLRTTRSSLSLSSSCQCGRVSPCSQLAHLNVQFKSPPTRATPDFARPSTHPTHPSSPFCRFLLVNQ